MWIRSYYTRTTNGTSIDVGKYFRILRYETSGRWSNSTIFCMVPISWVGLAFCCINVGTVDFEPTTEVPFNFNRCNASLIYKNVESTFTVAYKLISYNHDTRIAIIDVLCRVNHSAINMNSVVSILSHTTDGGYKNLNIDIVSTEYSDEDIDKSITL